MSTFENTVLEISLLIKALNKPFRPKKIKISFLYPFWQWIEVLKKLIRMVKFVLLFFGFFYLPNNCATVPMSDF